MADLTRDMTSALAQSRIRRLAKAEAGNRRISRTTLPRGDEALYARVAKGAKMSPISRTPADKITAAHIDRAMSRLAKMRRAQDRSPANKLARTILKRGVDPQALRDKLGRSAIDNMGYMGLGPADPKKAASRATKAATVAKAMRLAYRTTQRSESARQLVRESYAKNKAFFGPGGQRIKSR